MAIITAGQGTKLGTDIPTLNGYTYIDTSAPFDGNGQLSTFKYDQAGPGANPFFIIVVYLERGKYKIRGWAEFLSKTTGGNKVYNAPADFEAIQVRAGDMMAYYSELVPMARNAGGSPNKYDRITGNILKGEWSGLVSFADSYIEFEGTGEDLFSRIDTIDVVNYNYQMNYNEKTHLEIGDWNEIAGYKPTLDIHKWNSEATLKISYPGATIAIPTLTNFDGVDGIITWENPLNSDVVRIFSKQPVADFIENGIVIYEIEVGIKPATNIVELNVDDTGSLNILKQNAYNAITIPEEDNDTGVDYRSETEGRVGGSTGDLVISIPERVTNSIAIYGQCQCSGFKSQVEADTKRTGKFAHIIRVIATDDNSVQVYCDLDLDFDLGKLYITIPTLFYNSAKYPIRIDLEIGFTEFGATSYKTAQIIGPQFQITETNGIVEKMVFAVANWDELDRLKTAIYEIEGDLKAPQSIERSEGATDTTFVEIDLTSLGGVNAVNTVKYLASMWLGDGQSLKRDICFNSISGYNSDSSYGLWPANLTVHDIGNFYSAYIKYLSNSTKYFGIDVSTFQYTAKHTEYMYMAGVSSDTNDMLISKFFVRMLVEGTISIALYTGLDISDLTTFTILSGTEIFNYKLESGWNSIPLSANIAIPKNTPVAIGWTNDNGSIFYTDVSSQSGDFQTANGRWKQTSPIDADESAIMPTTPGAGSFTSFFYAVNFEYRIIIAVTGAINTTLEPTVIVSTGELPYVGTTNTTLEPTAIVSTGEFNIPGWIDTTLEQTLVEMFGTRDYTGQILATLEESVLQASGGKLGLGGIGITLAETTVIATGVKDQPGYIDASLQETTINIIAGKVILGSLNPLLPGLKITASAILKLIGTINTQLKTTKIIAIGEYKYSGAIVTTLEQTTIITIAEKYYRGSIYQKLRATQIQVIGSVIIQGGIDIALPQTKITTIGNIPFIGVIDVLLASTSFSAISKRGFVGVVASSQPETAINTKGITYQKNNGSISISLSTTIIDQSGIQYQTSVINTTLEQTTINIIGEKDQPGNINTTLLETEFVSNGLTTYEGSITQLLPEIETIIIGGVPTKGDINTALNQTTIISNGTIYGSPITWTLIKNTIYRSLKKIINERSFSQNTEIIWAEENGVQPKDQYLSLRINTNKAIGMDAGILNKDNPGEIKYIGNQEFVFSITGYGDNMMCIMQRIIASYMNRIDIRSDLANGSVVFVETINTENVTELWDKRFKEVVSLDILFRTHQQITENTGWVDSYEWESKLLSNTGNKTSNETGIVNLP